MIKRLLFGLIGLLAVSSLSSCGYNTMVAQDENVKAKWAQVENVYQRRADLIPNLVTSELNGHRPQQPNTRSN
jgi:LemA protein